MVVRRTISFPDNVYSEVNKLRGKKMEKGEEINFSKQVIELVKKGLKEEI